MQEMLHWKQQGLEKYFSLSELTPAGSLVNIFNAASYDDLTYTYKTTVVYTHFCFSVV